MNIFIIGLLPHFGVIVNLKLHRYSRLCAHTCLAT